MSYSGDPIKTKLVWSVSNFTKMFVTIAVTAVVAIYSLNALHVRWDEGGEIVVILDTILIGLWAALFIPNRNLEWFGRTDVHLAKKWYNVLLLTRERYSDVKKSLQCYFIPVLLVSAFVLAVKFWESTAFLATFAAVLAVIIYVAEKISTVRIRKEHKRQVEKYNAEDAAELKVENDRRLAEYPALLAERNSLRAQVKDLRDGMIQGALADAEYLIMAKMLVETSKEEGIKSKFLADARRYINTVIKSQPLGQEQLDVIELKVCRALDKAPEKNNCGTFGYRPRTLLIQQVWIEEVPEKQETGWQGP